jgi:hypothetical protein
VGKRPNTLQPDLAIPPLLAHELDRLERRALECGD